MLRMHVVRQGGHHYYVKDLVPGRAEGTLVAGEEPGVWSGAGSHALGLRGTVESEVFAEVLDGRDPVSGRALRLHRGDASVAAYDLTFAAPKSVSLLHLLAPREIATQVGDGHRAAVNEATDYLGRAALGVRRTRNGQVSFLASTGPVAGHFLHRTSRTLDPHLHTHVVAANVAQGVDGRWSAVDSRRVFAHMSAAQGIYHARLRLELSDRIGATWEVPRSGLGDVIGVDRTMRRLFSQRSAGMDEYEARRSGPTSGPSRARGAFHATRPDKDRTRSVESLVAEWKERAADFGFDLGDLTRVVGRKHGPQVEAEIDPRRMRTGLGRLADDNKWIAHRHLVAVVAAACTEGASAGVVESVATHIAEASGRSTDNGRAARPLPEATTSAREARTLEPRWRARDVARAMERWTTDFPARPDLPSARPDVVERSIRPPTRRVDRDHTLTISSDNGRLSEASLQLGH
jgi:conjugative relaxase-like TrwC/TraI family protein